MKRRNRIIISEQKPQSVQTDSQATTIDSQLPSSAQIIVSLPALVALPFGPAPAPAPAAADSPVEVSAAPVVDLEVGSALVALAATTLVAGR